MLKKSHHPFYGNSSINKTHFLYSSQPHITPSSIIQRLPQLFLFSSRCNILLWCFNFSCYNFLVSFLKNQFAEISNAVQFDFLSYLTGCELKKKLFGQCSFSLCFTYTRRKVFPFIGLWVSFHKKFLSFRSFRYFFFNFLYSSFSWSHSVLSVLSSLHSHTFHSVFVSTMQQQ